jgi:hypothetical protein
MQSGTRDKEGNWIPETPQAKIRNKLCPFWTLTDILSNNEMIEKLLESEKGRELIKSLVERCQENKSTILELINETEK